MDGQGVISSVFQKHTFHIKTLKQKIKGITKLLLYKYIVQEIIERKINIYFFKDHTIMTIIRLNLCTSHSNITILLKKKKIEYKINKPVF